MEDKRRQRNRIEEERLRRVRLKRRRKRNIRRFVLMTLLLCMISAAAAVWHSGRVRMTGNEAETEEAPKQMLEEASQEESPAWEGELTNMDALYGIYVKDVGWSHFFPDNSYGMAPADNYVTAFRATLKNQPAGMSGTISYRVNLSGSGWLDWVEDGAGAGSEGGEQPLESVCIRLTGALEQYYDVHYSVLQNGAWTDWVMNGAEAGQCGVGLRVDGIRISVVQKQENGSYAGGIDPNRPMVALTYDDGPSASATPRILNVLEEQNARATFFMVGKMAQKQPALIARMVELGCEVGNHTYDHTLMSKVEPSELARQLALTNQVVSDASGVSPVLMRPCGGDRNDIGMCIVGAISMPAVLWSVDTLDWKTRDPEKTIEAIRTQVKDGDIILMHDLYDTTAAASEVIIPELVAQGYQLVTVSELASYRGGMLPGKSYSRFRP